MAWSIYALYIFIAKEDAKNNQLSYQQYFEEYFPLNDKDIPNTGLKHKYTVEIRRAMYSDDSFKIFDWYHKGVHPDKINTKEGFSRFLCRSPLYDQKDNYERNKAFRTDKKYDQDREFKDEGVFPAFHGSYHMYHKIDGQTFAIVSFVFV